MLIVLNVSEAGGVISRRPAFWPAAAAQYVHRSPSTALAASKARLVEVASTQVESAEAGCPCSRLVAYIDPTHEPNCASRSRSGVSN